MLQFQDDFLWKGKGVLTPAFQEAATFQELFTVLVKETKEAGGVYQKHVANDGSLIGNERFDLAMELEDLLGGYLQIYRLILKVASGTFHSACNGENFSFTAEFDSPAWRAKGYLRKAPVTGSFSTWFNGTLLPATAGLVKGYGEVFADGKMEQDEKERLLQELNGLMITLLLADRGLKDGSLS